MSNTKTAAAVRTDLFAAHADLTALLDFPAKWTLGQILSEDARRDSIAKAAALVLEATVELSWAA